MKLPDVIQEIIADGETEVSELVSGHSSVSLLLRNLASQLVQLFPQGPEVEEVGDDIVALSKKIHGLIDHKPEEAVSPSAPSDEVAPG